MDSIKAIPHKDRLRALYAIYLQNFRHLAHKSLDIRQYICEISVQSDENSDSVSYVQSLCGIALNIIHRLLFWKTVFMYVDKLL